MKIVLDAGHGKNEKAFVFKSFYEGNNNFTACGLLKRELEKYAGVEVVLTRENLEDNPEVHTERGQLAWDADLFYSWHSDGVSAENAYGVSIYHSIYTEDEELGKAVGNALVNAFGYPTYLRKVTTKVYSNSRKDLDYYAVIRNAVLTNGQKLNETPKRSNCKHCMIVEHGFHSNRREAEILLNPIKLEQIVIAEATAIATYFHLSKKVIKGDINGDGIVNNDDLNMLKRYLMGFNKFTDEQKKRADINGDGKINMLDYVALKRLIKNGHS